jgi:hypothetical protein
LLTISDPSGLGRFISEDPKVFDRDDYNLFRYCHNDPVDLTDPMGLQDTVHANSPQEASKLKADEEYGQAMAAAQWANTRTNLQGSTIAAGMAGYSQWSAKRRKGVSPHY